MRIIPQAEVDRKTNCEGGELLPDEAGQLIVYTCMFQWMDGTERDEPDPTYDPDYWT